MHLALGHEPRLHQIGENLVGAGAGFRGVGVRGVLRRSLEQAREDGGLRQVYIAHRFAEIELRRRLHAEIAAAQIRAVEIKLQDFPLCKMRLKPEGQVHLLDLTRHRAFGAEEEVFGKLLRDGAAALNGAVRPRVLDDRAPRAQDVNAEMFEEPPVLGGHRRLDERVGNFLKRHGIRELNASLADLVAVAVLEGHAELAAGAPVRVLGKFERGDLEHEDDEKPARPNRRRLGQEFHGKPPEPGHTEAGKEIVIVCPPVFKSGI